MRRFCYDFLDIVCWYPNMEDHIRSSILRNNKYFVEMLYLSQGGIRVIECENFPMNLYATGVVWRELVPDMEHELSKAWKQPDSGEIYIGHDTAKMSRPTFKVLREYNTSYPTALYTGKMWKQWVQETNEYYLRWCTQGKEPDKIDIQSRKILITGE